VSNRDLAEAMMRMLRDGYSIRFDRGVANPGGYWCVLYDALDAPRANGFDESRTEGLREMFADFAYMRL
jgi:hypothetical protein